MAEARDGTERVEEGRSEQLRDELICEKALAESVIAALPVHVLAVDGSLNIVFASRAYCEECGLPMEDVRGKNIGDVLPSTLLADGSLVAAVESALATDERVEWSGEQRVSMQIVPVACGCGERHALLTIEDVVEQHRELYELSMLQQIAQAMLGMLELPRLLHAILTAMTAGGAAGLGFNRAFLMLIDRESGLLKVEMAVGPASASEAAEIWSKIGTHDTTIRDFLAKYHDLPSPEESAFYGTVSRMEIPLDDAEHLPVSVLSDGATAHVVDAHNDARVSEVLLEFLGAGEFVVAPLVAKGRRIGVAYADNYITGRAISQPDMQLFTSLANHAALAIDTAAAYEGMQRRAQEVAEAYAQLEAAQERLVRSESLAAIGETTAIVAHEIRNPLSTIGGFAKLMVRQADEPETVQRNAQIIYDEAMRLEEIVSGLLAFSRPGKPRFQWCDASEILHRSVNLLMKKVDTSRIDISIECDADLPPLYVDPAQIDQVLDNLMRNAISAMAEGGRLVLSASNGRDGRVTVAVRDTGHGIPASHLGKILETFFSTKPGGMGLGLTLANKIIHEHGAKMNVDSQQGVGTTFSLIFPTDHESLKAAGIVEEEEADQNARKE